MNCAFPIVQLFEITGKKGMKLCKTIGNLFVGQLRKLRDNLEIVLIVINLFYSVFQIIKGY